VIRVRSLLALLLALVLASPAAAQVLATPQQIAHERTVLRILARPELLAATARVEALYRADAQARTAAGKARLRRAASSIATAAVNYALSEDPSHPAVVWWVNAPHRWHGISVPGSGFGIDNPDNIYQGFTVAGGGRYRVTGRMPAPAPLQLHLEVRDSIPGLGQMAVEGGQLLATLQSEDMAIAADGSFTITVDSEPVAGRANHLAVPPEGVFMINVRQLLTDWGRQRPIALTVERLDPVPPAPPRDVARFAARAATILDRIAPYWLDYDNRFIFASPANRLRPLRVRPGGRGWSASGHYALADDEALVITADARGAASLGVQIADPWGVAYDYDRRTSSLNNHQAQPDRDGAFTFIVSARDPGLANWLDSGGHASGMVILRWQALPVGASPDGAIRSVRVAKLAELVPSGQPRMTPAQRRAQRTERARQYAVRMQR
jgi:hypothetical protein